MISFFIVLGIYVMLCYYIGSKGKNVILNLGTKFRGKKYLILYWIIYWSIALAYIFYNILIGLSSVDNWFISTVGLIGTTYLCALVYLLIMFFIVDILRFTLKKINIKASTKEKLKKVYFNGLSVFVIGAILISFGIWNAQNEVVTNYKINVDKYAERINSLNIVMISDAHLGIGIKENGVSKMVNSINALNPDIVVFCGDIFDGNTPTSLKEYSREAFKNIKAKYGVYAITGNHEYGAGELSETISYFKDANINFLQDECTKVADSFYIVGRNDHGSIKSVGQDAAPLDEILKDADKSLPIIVLNHRPERLEEAESENVDLQLSGHTHKGQIFPFITRYMYELDYGYLKKDNFNLIVSSGYGTWGPPVRIGSKSEMVHITVDFKK